MLGIFLVEFLNSAGSIHKFLLTGEKRMACRTDLNMYLFINGTKLKFAAASTFGRYLIVFRMYSRLHFLQASEKIIFKMFIFTRTMNITGSQCFFKAKSAISCSLN